MFERYTEKARRVIFFARYEASQFGSPYIETEHLLLGVLREDKSVSTRAIPNLDAESFRQEIERATLTRKVVPTSVDLPLSNESKRVLDYAAEEAARLNHDHIGSEHLLLGLLSEQTCFAARLLKERGVTLETARSIVSGDAELVPNAATAAGTNIVVASGLQSGAERHAMMQRSILFQNEISGADLGETLSIDVPRVGEEIAMPWIRGRVTRVVHEYEQANLELAGRKVDLKPEKIIVYLQPLEETAQ